MPSSQCDGKSFNVHLSNNGGPRHRLSRLEGVILRAGSILINLSGMVFEGRDVPER